MADKYMVGSSQKKDRYMVGQKQGSDIYKVGGGGSSVSDSSNNSLGGGDQGSPVGQKSAFSYGEADKRAGEIGDKNENSNFGGKVSDGMGSDDAGKEYHQEGDYSEAKDAMARRKALLEGMSKYMSSNEIDSPVK